MTVDEFLAWECQQELRYEFDGWQPVEMNGSTYAHSVIATNVWRFLVDNLPQGWRVVSRDLQVRMGSRVRYPDVAATRARLQNQDRAIPDPVLLVEVLSNSTAIVDQTSKAAEYTAIDSLQHYLMLEQDSAEAVLLSRSDEGWIETTIVGLSLEIALPALGLSLPMLAAYKDVLPPSA